MWLRRSREAMVGMCKCSTSCTSQPAVGNSAGALGENGDGRDDDGSQNNSSQSLRSPSVAGPGPASACSSAALLVMAGIVRPTARHIRRAGVTKFGCPALRNFGRTLRR